MARIFLIRHGETKANNERRYQGQIDTPLNKNGIRQATELSKLVRQIPFTRIYTTPLQRAQTTAQLIAKPHRLDICIVPELMERNFGAWEDLTFEQISARYSKLYKQWLITPNTPIPNSESFPAFKKRVLSGLKKATGDLKPHDTIAIIAHGGPNRIILQHYLGISDDKSFWKIKQDNACINVIEVQTTYNLVSLMNYHGNNFHIDSIRY